MSGASGACVFLIHIYVCICGKEKVFISISGTVILTTAIHLFSFHLILSTCRNLPAILDWVKTQKPGAMGVNIITSDFVDLVDFATTVIELNDLLEDRALTKC